MITERDRQRLEALIAIVKPANSTAARLEMLSDEQREYFEEWKTYCDRWFGWCKTRSDGEECEARPYAHMIDGFGPPNLRDDDIYTALFGPKPVIPITATLDEAARIYKDYCDDR